MGGKHIGQKRCSLNPTSSLIAVLAILSLSACKAGVDGTCGATSDCAEGLRCVRQVCVDPAAQHRCEQSAGCKDSGQCFARRGACVVGPDADCRRARFCTSKGHCTLAEGRCGAATDADCKDKDICRSHGACQATGGACRPRSTAWCRGLTICRELGRCSLDPDGLCVAASDADCRRSAECTRRRRCTADQGECNATTAAAYYKETAALISRLHTPDEAKVAAAADELLQRAWASRITAAQAGRVALLMREGDRQWKKSYPGRTRTIQIKHYAGKILAGMGIGQIGPALKREAVAAMRSGARLERRRVPKVKVPLYRRTLNIPGLPKVIRVPKLTPEQAAGLARYRKRIIFRRRGSS